MSEETALTTEPASAPPTSTGGATQEPPIGAGAEPDPAQGGGTEPSGEAASTDPIPAPLEDDWRTPFSGGDDKIAELLNRYNSPDELGKALLSQRHTLSERMGAVIPGEDASDEQIRSFNEAHSIPERADGYTIEYKPPEGLVDERDAPFLQAIREDLHAKGGVLAMPGVMEAVHEKFYEIKEAQFAQFEKEGQSLSRQNIDSLKQEWGAEYNTNVSLARGALQTYADMADPDDFLNRKMADGTSIGDNPTIIKMLARFARATGDDAIFTKAAGAADARGLEEQITEYKKLKDTDPAAYAKALAPGGELHRLMGLRARKSAAA